MIELIHFKTIDSTNAFLKRNHERHPHGTVIHADHQTHGKGRLGKTWKDDFDGALFSILLKEAPETSKLMEVTQVAVVACHQYLGSIIENLKIKWPNDLYVGGKKIAGILVESIIIGGEVRALIVGFGVNLNNRVFDSELFEKATSMALLTQQEYDIYAFIKSLSLHFMIIYDQYLNNQLDIGQYVKQYLIEL